MLRSDPPYDLGFIYDLSITVMYYLTTPAVVVAILMELLNYSS